ncbi:unnamed protein product [Orchesella dallaii]|uniref:RING-type domain-containing protein n=1 Tax=Orchesella dallaii TaxID=48710 RepID=A0ABP1RLD0_9HEXA
MENLRECPICLEPPEREIYQCLEGHIICSVCIEKLVECPQCRTNYGARRIRCRVLEAILDDQLFECKFNENGCSHLCPRSDISNHVNSCEFNQDSIPLCSLVGLESFSDCKFRVACSGGVSKSGKSEIIDHFKVVHQRGLRYRTNINKKGHLIKEAIQKSLTGRPMVTMDLLSLSSERTSPLFMLVMKINSANEFIALNCIQIWSADASKKYKVNCSVIKPAKSPPTANSNEAVSCGIDDPVLISWTMNVHTPRKMEYTMKSCPIGINKSVLMDIKFGDNVDDRLQIDISLIK